MSKLALIVKIPVSQKKYKNKTPLKYIALTKYKGLII